MTDVRRTIYVGCPWCGSTKAVLRPNGIVSHAECGYFAQMEPVEEQALLTDLEVDRLDGVVDA